MATLIGQTIRSYPGFRSRAWFFLVLGGLLIGIGVVDQNLHEVILALLPLFIGLALWSIRERGLVLEFTEQGIQTIDPPSAVLYDRIEGLLAPRRPDDPTRPGPRAYSIDVLHRDGVLRIPKVLDVPSDDVFRFLHGRLTPGGSREVNPALLEHLQQQIKTFGSENVWSYRARAHLGRNHMTAMAVTTAAIGVTGIAWVLMALLGKSFAVWGAVGPVVAILGFMSFFLARPKTNAPAIIKWQVSGFVISPAGLAIVQGNVKGELKWSELKDVRYQPTRKFQVAADPTMLGIVLVLDGAKMVIVNIYDRPLRMIHERILQYWR